METGFTQMQADVNTYSNEDNIGVQRLASYLRVHKKINPIQALKELGIYRLGARVYELRHKYDWIIECKKTQVGRKIHSEYIVITIGKEIKDGN
jgi:hypothetical protein